MWHCTCIQLSCSEYNYRLNDTDPVLYSSADYSENRPAVNRTAAHEKATGTRHMLFDDLPVNACVPVLTWLVTLCDKAPPLPSQVPTYTASTCSQMQDMDCIALFARPFRLHMSACINEVCPLQWQDAPSPHLLCAQLH